ncbi:PTS sugar transporter subunit IIC [Fonticella tunisiensis]|uniref:Permease IIC component n=1 Tax=Fonticella tunisiensis TaxID=1096341 RepID=A0A4R7KPN3_9CLOT|nr:PTS transporter subunit EIIC [Fonticella tunisiensis]TDT56508.1 PTS system cellobiose-specific IIC component [Fonticella tunisiensis]
MAKTKMDSFVAILEKHIAPIASQIEKQRHIASIKNGMISLLAVLMVGSISLIITGLGNFFPEGSLIRNFFDAHNHILNLPFMFTYGLLSIYCAISISYAHSRQLELQPLHSIIGGVLATLILNGKYTDGAFDFSFLDSRGLFISIFASLIAVEIMAFLIRKQVTIRIKGLPDMIGKTFEAIIPLLIIIILSVIVNQITLSLSGGKNLSEVFTVMFAPAVNSIDTPLAVFVVSLSEMIFWFLGLNGYAILVGFTLPFMTQYLAENAAAFSAGQVPTHIFTENWWGYFLACTGSGITGAIAILGLFSKSKELKAAGKAAIVPAIFNISEPVVYGFPVVYNPYLFIPFVFGTPILGLFSYYIFKLGIVRAPIASIGGMPTPVAQYLVTLDWKAIILSFIIVALGVLMYYPFFKMYEKSVLAQEKEENTVEQEILKELDLDF